MKIVVLGASGQIGSALFDGLWLSHEVVGTSRSGSNGLLRFDPFKDDWCVLGKPDVLMNCIGQIADSRAFTFDRIHVGITKLIIANRSKIGDPRVIQMSALGASGDADVDFLKTKGIADDLLLRSTDTYVVRPSIVCTNRTMIVKRLLTIARLSTFTGGVLLLPKGFLATQIQPVMPADVVDVVGQLCNGGSKRIVDVVGPDRLSFTDLFSMLQTSRALKLRFIQLPRWVADFFLGNGVPKLMNKQQYKLLFKNNIGDAIALEDMLGRKLCSTLDFFRKEFTYATD